jgi:hypothetical protein
MVELVEVSAKVTTILIFTWILKYEGNDLHNILTFGFLGVGFLLFIISVCMYGKLRVRIKPFKSETYYAL